MRTRVMLVVCVLLFTPIFFLHAETAKEGSSKTEEASKKPAHEGKTDICLSEEVGVEDGELVTEEKATTTPEYKQCKEADSNKGCTAELEKEGKCKCGTVTYTVTPDGKPCVISKCDPEGEKTAEKCVAKGGLSLTSILERQKLRDYIATTGKLPPWVEEAFTDQQLKTVEGRLTTDKASVADQIASLYYPRNAKEQEEAARGLGITPEQLQKLATNSVRLTPEQQQQIVGGGGTEYLAGGGGDDLYDGAQQTFGNPSGQVELAPRGAPSAPTTKRGSAEMIDPRVLGYLAADAQRRICAVVQGTCYVTTEAQFATMMNETTGDVRALGDGGNSASLAQAYSSQSVFNTYLARYRAVFGEDYVLHRVNIKDPSINPEWIASQSVRMQAIILQDKAQSTGGDFTRQVTAYNGSGPAAVAYGQRALNNAYLLQGGRAAQYWQAAFNSAKEGGGPSVTNLPASGLPVFTGGGSNYSGYSGSPFGNVSPFGGGSYRSGFNTVAPVGAPGGGVAPGGGQQGGATQFQPTQGSSGTRKNNDTKDTSKDTTKSGTSTKSILDRARSALGNLLDAVNPDKSESTETKNPVDPVSTIFAQPQTITRGDSLLVSWSSLGMSTDIPCRVLVTSGTVTSLLAEGNDGSETIETDGSQPEGVWKFTLRCTAQKNGALVDQEALVTVE